MTRDAAARAAMENINSPGRVVHVDGPAPLSDHDQRQRVD
jgi:hypothetical protein